MSQEFVEEHQGYLVEEELELTTMEAVLFIFVASGEANLSFQDASFKT